MNDELIRPVAEPCPETRKAYHTPRLVDLGALRELTQGNLGAGVDGGGGGSSDC